MKHRRVEYFSSSEFEEEETIIVDPAIENLQFFSLAQDLKTALFPTPRKFRLLIQEYSKYIKSKKSTIKKEVLDEIDKLLIAKFNTLVNEVEENLKKGQSLDIVLRITDRDMKKSAKLFSREYKKMLVARAAFNYIPRDIQTKVDATYKVLIADLRKLVFEPVLNLFSFDPEGLPEKGIDETDDTTKKVLLEGNPTLGQLRELILGIFRKENIDVEVEIVEDKIVINYA